MLAWYNLARVLWLDGWGTICARYVRNSALVLDRRCEQVPEAFAISRLDHLTLVIETGCSPHSHI